MTVTRFAPSPTGYLHVGNLRTALFNFLIARKSGGQFILRLDDTDPERSKAEYADGIKQDLEWLGLTWDRVETQSSRLDLYAEGAERLRAAGRFYECFETPVDLDLKRKKLLNMGKPPVYDRAARDLTEAQKETLRKDHPGYWRFLLDQQRIEWKDGIIGAVSIDAASVSDPVLIRGDGQVLYTLASVVDDTEMGITHVVRGADHVTNTATQIQIIQSLGGDLPSFSHHSLLTGPQGEALSKRLGTLALRDLRDAGIEPMALLSHMARLGSSEPIELCSTVDELISGFDLGHFGTAPTKFDAEDLKPLTHRYVSTLSLDDMAAQLKSVGVPDDLADDFWQAIRENINIRAEVSDWWRMCRDGAEAAIDEEDREFVQTAIAMLPERPFDQSTWPSWTAAVKQATGRKGRGLFMPLRKALTGMAHGPDMAKLLPLLHVIKLD